jgi:subfamily B ATP-binding cassette protein MsbA
VNSGKSTISQLLLRFYNVNSGEIFFDDMPTTDLDSRWIHRGVGVVQQNPALLTRSVSDNMAHSGEVLRCDDAVHRAAEIEFADQVIWTRTEGYDSMVGEMGKNLSGGERQRIAIARAIIRNTTVVIADEGTPALDVIGEREVRAALDVARHGRTSIIRPTTREQFALQRQ